MLLLLKLCNMYIIILLKKYRLCSIFGGKRPSYFVYIEQTTNNKQTTPQTSGKHLLVICNCKNDITQDTPILRYNDLK